MLCQILQKWPRTEVPVISTAHASREMGNVGRFLAMADAVLVARMDLNPRFGDFYAVLCADLHAECRDFSTDE